MIGDYTEIPLRPDERWTAARMQEGRVLLDHEWNLNLDAASRAAEWAAADVIGPAGVAEGSDAFAVGVTTSGTLDLTVRPGRMWVGGMAALAPAPFAYSAQDQIDDLPAGGRAFVYLDAFAEHVQPAESPDELIDPALAPIDSAARSGSATGSAAGPRRRPPAPRPLAEAGGPRALRRAADRDPDRRRPRRPIRARRPGIRWAGCPTASSASRCSTPAPPPPRASPGRSRTGRRRWPSPASPATRSPCGPRRRWRSPTATWWRCRGSRAGPTASTTGRSTR